jgi:hypothetical protein
MWLAALLASPPLAALWSLHPSHGRALVAIGGAVLALLGTVALGCSLEGSFRLRRLGALTVTGTLALIAEYVLAYALAAPNEAGADDAAAVGAVMLSMLLATVLASLLAIGLGLRAVVERLGLGGAAAPPRPDVLHVDSFR